jgi:uncharacterized protein YndB with AHSA1/START domain
MSPSTNTSDAIVIERTFNAPIDVVWRMWTDAEEFAGWYGPPNATIPVADFDLRVGGRRRVCMEMPTPNGSMRMWFGGEHRTIEPPTLLIYSEQVTDEHGIPAPGGLLTEVRVELTRADSATRMVMTHLGVPSDSPGAMGWNMAFEKLDKRLGRQSS